MDEHYFSLKVGNNKEQFGSVLRTREGKLEELIGFYRLQEVGEISKKPSVGDVNRFRFYEANIHTDGHGKQIGNPDIVGLMVFGSGVFKGDVEIYKQPKKGANISEISMTKAAEILKDVQYLRDTEAFII